MIEKVKELCKLVDAIEKECHLSGIECKDCILNKANFVGKYRRNICVYLVDIIKEIKEDLGEVDD